MTEFYEELKSVVAGDLSRLNRLCMCAADQMSRAPGTRSLLRLDPSTIQTLLMLVKDDKSRLSLVGQWGTFVRWIECDFDVELRIDPRHEECIIEALDFLESCNDVCEVTVDIDERQWKTFLARIDDLIARLAAK